MIAQNQNKKLGLRNKFVVSLILEEPQELIIYNSHTGKTMKFRNPLENETLAGLVEFLQEEGVPNLGGNVYRALLEGYEIREMLNPAENGEWTDTYARIVGFLAQ